MNQKEFFIGEKVISILDDCFTMDQRIHFYDFLKNSFYKIGTGASDSIEEQSHAVLKSYFSDEDVQSFGFFKYLPEGIQTMLYAMQRTRNYSYLSDHKFKTHFHVDKPLGNDHLTLLYYANLKWDPDWGGETSFANDDLSEIEFTSLYKPGRIIIFDSTIPHKSNCVSQDSPEFRFTYVANFRKK